MPTSSFDKEKDIDRSQYKRLNLSKLNFSSRSISTEEALRDVIPIQWSNDIISGKKEVIIKGIDKGP